MNAVIYARYSSQGQNEQSIDGQLRVCCEFAQRKGLNIIHEYIDKARTAFKDSEKRVEFQKMIRDAEQGKFQIIVVYMLDRFSRIRAESMLTKMKLGEYGVKVLSAQENISETEEGQFFEMFLEYNAEMYSRRLSKRVRNGMTTSVNNGTFTGGHIQYGYKVNSKKCVEIDETRAEILRFLFEKYSVGWSKNDIAKALNEQGHRYNNKPFLGRHFDRWLTNEKYTGQFIFGGRECNNTFPPIIDKQVFMAVKDRLVSNKRNCGAKTTKEPYHLNGRAYCGHCGAPLIADGTTKYNGLIYKWYSCRNRKKGMFKCDKKHEKKNVLEFYVVQRIIAYQSDSELVQEFAERMVAWYDDRTGQKVLKSIEMQIATLRKQIDGVINLIIENASNKSMVARLEVKHNDIDKQISDLQNEYERIDSLSGMKLKTEHIVEFINHFIKGNPADIEFQARIIKNLLNCIYVYDDKFVIYFNLTNRKEVIFVGLEETDEVVGNNSENCEISGSNIIAYTPPER